jgi:DNA-binding NarL/FixJ family response regulator
MNDGIAILGGYELFADAMRVALERMSLPVLFSAPLTDDVVEAVRSANASVVVLDAGSAGDALPWIERLREAAIVRSILVIVGSPDDEGLVAVVEAGAHGTIHPESSLGQLVRAIRSRHPAASARMISLVGTRIHNLARELRRETTSTETLTERESQVLRLLSLRLSNKDIARELGIWTQTVKTHLHNIYSKLGVRSRREAVTHALRTGLLRETTELEAASASSDPIDTAIEAVQGSRPKRVAIVSRAIVEIERMLGEHEPRSFRSGGSVTELLAAIDGSAPAVEEFTRLAEAAAAAVDAGVTIALYKALHGIIDRYGPPANGGRFDPRDFDYYRFVGHEMVVTLIAALLARRRWNVIGDLLNQRLVVSNAAGWHTPHAVSFGCASELLEALDEVTEKRRVVSVHAELLEARHSSGPLARVPFDDFAAADYFLFLRGELSAEAPPQRGFEWRPWSTGRLRSVPWFIREARNAVVAAELGTALGVEKVGVLRTRLLERAPRLELLWRSRSWQSPLSRADFQRVGTIW